VAAKTPTRVVYVTARLPFGDGEPFIVPEVVALSEQGCELTIVPVRAGGPVADPDARGLLPRTVAVGLVSPGVLWAALREAFRSPRRVGGALALLRGRDLRILAKNLAVFPKALWLARRIRETEANHVHAHWASTSSSLAMAAGHVADVPWSLTAHRWDIAEDNLLQTKARTACFVRVISEHGATELRGLVGEPDWSPWVLYMGVRLPSGAGGAPPEGPLRILTAARFVEKKGHGVLLDALALLRDRGVSVRVELAGDGPLEKPTRARVSQLGLTGMVEFLGRVSHDDLLADLERGRWDVMALPSIVTHDGQLEGIPVSLIEAMACGVPVVGTDAGGVPELLADEAGILVPPGSHGELAAALELLARDPRKRGALAERGRARIEAAFAVERIAAALLDRFRDCAAGRR
jgi:colanic acid/amylovoran biosynthesis glycosyltransferase